MPNYLNPDDLETIAIALKDLNKEVVFVGGAVCRFYADEQAAPSFRPTDDVDCIVEIQTHRQYTGLEKQLRSLGFTHDMSPGAPICRKLFNNIKVDFMPSDEKVIGLSAKWFQEGLKNTMEITLPRKTIIRILKLPYFLATKFEAFLGRGKGNFYTSHDFEDIVNVIAYRKSLHDFDSMPRHLKEAFGNWSKMVISEIGILDTIKSHLPSYESIKLSERVLGLFQEHMI